jgi:hypothetical protein
MDFIEVVSIIFSSIIAAKEVKNFVVHPFGFGAVKIGSGFRTVSKETVLDEVSE